MNELSTVFVYLIRCLEYDLRKDVLLLVGQPRSPFLTSLSIIVCRCLRPLSRMGKHLSTDSRSVRLDHLGLRSYCDGIRALMSACCLLPVSSVLVVHVEMEHNIVHALASSAS